VAATGLRPRRLGLPVPAAGRYPRRPLEDRAALLAALDAGRRALVHSAVCTGYVLAATSLRLSWRLAAVRPTGASGNRVLGRRRARAVHRHHERAGIAFVLGRSLAGFTGDTRVSGVELDDGTRLDADVVVEAVGCVPNTEWLAGNAGLDLSDGVRCDNRMLADGSDRLVAAGDVARFPNPLFDDVPRRVEHWSIPADTARRAAATLTALLAGDAPDPAPFTPVPS